MADDVEMTPVDAAEPPKANPLATPKVETLKLTPQARPPIPGAAVSALKTGLKLPTVALKPGIKLPPKPVIRKPGATVTAAPLPKPVAPLPKPVEPQAAKPADPLPAASAAPEKPAAKPVSVDAQGVGKLPTVEAKAVDRADTAPTVSANPKPLEALKSVTQKLKGLTQEIPQQAILRKTGIIAEGAMSEAQKEAAKHKTARISLSDAMGVAPVKNENAPMKTIRIKRPVDISGATKPAATLSPAAPAGDLPPVENPSAEAAEAPASTVTQRKTLKISRPGGAVRPSGKFGVKRPGQATTVAKSPAAEGADAGAGGEAPVADIGEIPDMPMAPVPNVAQPAGEDPAWLVSLSMVVQAAACVAMGALAWFLYQNTQVSYF